MLMDIRHQLYISLNVKYSKVAHSAILPSIGMVRPASHRHILSWVQEAGAFLWQRHIHVFTIEEALSLPNALLGSDPRRPCSLNLGRAASQTESGARARPTPNLPPFPSCQACIRLDTETPLCQPVSADLREV